MENKVAFLLFSATAGGAERNAINFQRFTSIKTKCDIITIKPIDDYSSEYEDKNIRIISILDSTNKIPIYSYPFIFYIVLFRLLRISIVNQYDIFIGGSEYLPFYLAVFLAKLTKKKSILIVGNNISEELKHQSRIQGWLNRTIFRLCFRFTNHIISVSHGLTMRLKQDFEMRDENISTVYNAVDIKKIQALRKELPDNGLQTLMKNHSIITSFGRLTYKKGLCNLIRSFAHIHAKKPDTLLLIVGKGELSNELHSLVTNLSLSNNVKFLGFIPENPYSILAHSDVFAFTSYFEGFGNVLLEALASDTPIVSSNCQYGPLEILKGNKDLELYNKKGPIITDHGILIPPFTLEDSKKNEKLFANAVLEVITHKKKYKSRERLKHFSLQHMTETYEEIINKVLRK